MERTEHFDTVVIGAGAAGMMCAAHAGAHGGRVLVLDHAKAPGEKIRISGGGRCNFTNLHAAPQNFLSANPHFAKSALKRYTQHDFIALVEAHGIAYHEKTLGQLFCDGKSSAVIILLLGEMEKVGATLRLRSSVVEVTCHGNGFALTVETEGTRQRIKTRQLVVASGGKSIPKMGASGFGYRVAEQFGLAVTETRPALVPLTFSEAETAVFRELAGIGTEARVACGKTAFDEGILFTHRGLSGPAILQISSYWRETRPVRIDLAPGTDLGARLREARAENGRASVATALAEHLPKRLATMLCERHRAPRTLGEAGDKRLSTFAEALRRWELTPVGSEGYRTAEVTLGGV
ncbi:MAG: aminoacetone oxidase family FAD-binding enzyme, partial [Pseudomonadota bacterium]